MFDWYGLGVVLALGVLGLVAARVLLQLWLDSGKTKVGEDSEGFWARSRRG